MRKHNSRQKGLTELRKFMAQAISGEENDLDPVRAMIF